MIEMWTKVTQARFLVTDKKGMHADSAQHHLHSVVVLVGYMTAGQCLRKEICVTFKQIEICPLSACGCRGNTSLRI